MANISLRYSSRPRGPRPSPLRPVLATWRRRAQERRELANLDSPHDARPRAQRERDPVRGEQALLARLTLRIRSRPVSYPARAHPSPDTGRRSILSLPSTAGFFFCAHSVVCGDRPQRSARARRVAAQSTRQIQTLGRDALRRAAQAISPAPKPLFAQHRRGARPTSARRSICWGRSDWSSAASPRRASRWSVPPRSCRAMPPRKSTSRAAWRSSARTSSPRLALDQGGAAEARRCRHRPQQRPHPRGARPSDEAEHAYDERCRSTIG